jgi:hypothetical protein
VVLLDVDERLGFEKKRETNPITWSRVNYLAFRPQRRLPVAAGAMDD